LPKRERAAKPEHHQAFRVADSQQQARTRFVFVDERRERAYSTAAAAVRGSNFERKRVNHAYS